MIELTAEDLQEMADTMMGNIAPDPTEEELREVVRRDPHLYHLAREWTWGDTEARDQLYRALLKLRTEQVKAEHPWPWELRDRVVFDADGKVVIGETCGAPSALVAGWLVEIAERALNIPRWLE
jgi:hypothetical protein